MGTQRPQLQLKSADVWMLTYAFPFFSIASTNTSWRSKAKWKRPIKNLGIITVFLSAFCIVLSCHLTESLWLKLQGSLQHHATLGDRVDYLEKLMGDSADKHTNELGQAGKPICRPVPQTIMLLAHYHHNVRRPTQSWISYGVDSLLWRLTLFLYMISLQWWVGEFESCFKMGFIYVYIAWSMVCTFFGIERVLVACFFQAFLALLYSFLSFKLQVL